MSLNADQQDYVEYLARQAPADLCYCGWYRKGECPTCPRHLSCQDKIDRRCPVCRSAPWATDLERPIVHTKGCTFYARHAVVLPMSGICNRRRR